MARLTERPADLAAWERRWWDAHVARHGDRPEAEDAATLAAHLREEVEELRAEIARDALGPARVDPGEIGKELADCQMLLMALFRLYQLDPETTVAAKLDEVLARPEWACRLPDANHEDDTT